MKKKKIWNFNLIWALFTTFLQHMYMNRPVLTSKISSHYLEPYLPYLTPRKGHLIIIAKLSL